MSNGIAIDDPLGIVRIVSSFFPETQAKRLRFGVGSVTILPESQQIVPTPLPGIAGKPQMGFFSSLISGIGKVVGVVGRAVGILPAAAAAVAAPVARVAAPIVRAAPRALVTAARIAAPAAVAGAAFAVGERILAPSGLAAGGGAITGGNGRTMRVTRVATIDLATGEVIRTEDFKGAPFLMRNDVLIAKRVFRMASKLHGRMPARTRKQSLASTLKDKIMTKAIDAVGDKLVPCPS